MPCAVLWCGVPCPATLPTATWGYLGQPLATGNPEVQATWGYLWRQEILNDRLPEAAGLPGAIWGCLGLPRSPIDDWKSCIADLIIEKQSKHHWTQALLGGY